MNNNEPCEDCILLAMCVNKNWYRLLANCDLIVEYMIIKTCIRDINKSNDSVFYVGSLNKSFYLSRIICTNRVLIWPNSITDQSGVISGQYYEYEPNERTM